MVGRVCFVAQTLPKSPNAQENLPWLTSTSSGLAAAALYSYSRPPPIHSRSAPGKPLPRPGCTKRAARSCRHHAAQGKPSARTISPRQRRSSPKAGGGMTPAARPPSRRVLLTACPSALSSSLLAANTLPLPIPTPFGHGNQRNCIGDKKCPAPPVSMRTNKPLPCSLFAGRSRPLLLEPLSLTTAFFDDGTQNRLPAR